MQAAVVAKRLEYTNPHYFWIWWKDCMPLTPTIHPPSSYATERHRAKHKPSIFAIDRLTVTLSVFSFRLHTEIRLYTKLFTLTFIALSLSLQRFRHKKKIQICTPNTHTHTHTHTHIAYTTWSPNWLRTTKTSCSFLPPQFVHRSTSDHYDTQPRTFQIHTWGKENGSLGNCSPSSHIHPWS
jgi:hypothetical protein